jgi:hypothetical protein
MDLTFHRVARFVLGAILAFAASVAVASPASAEISLRRDAGSVAMASGECQPGEVADGCEMSQICDLMCLVSGLVMPPEPSAFLEVSAREAFRPPLVSLLAGIDLRPEPLPPRMTGIA